MREGLIEEIKSKGHWRVNIRPHSPLKQQLSYQDCTNLVEQNRVSIRGWDFPHIYKQNDDRGGFRHGDGFVECWTQFLEILEFWRMYRSGQFLSYHVLGEDNGGFNDVAFDGRVIGIVGVIYSVTEFAEFAHRCAQLEAFRGGVSLEVQLRNSLNRELWAGRNRVRFFDPPRSGAETIRVQRNVGPAFSNEAAIDCANSMILEVFDTFGWNPGRERVLEDQERFYNRQFS